MSGTAAIARTTPTSSALHQNATTVIIAGAPIAVRSIDQGGDQVSQYWDGIWNPAYSTRRTPVDNSNTGLSGQQQHWNSGLQNTGHQWSTATLAMAFSIWDSGH